MPYLYEQTTGKFFRDGALLGIGYSGHELGKNNTELQYVRNVGPIPEGHYRFGQPFNSKIHGPLCIPITPERDTDTRGRSGFLLHGDSLLKPGTASEGCIIQSRDVRRKVAANLATDDSLQVVSSIQATEQIT